MSKQPLLFDVPKTHPTKAERFKAFKAKHRIWTHDSGHKGDEMKWCAIALDIAYDALKGYVDTATKASPDDDLAFALISEACRLLDECELCANGATEAKAVADLCEYLKIPFVW